MIQRSTAAFSLIEVLCAILVLGVGVAGLTHGLTTAAGSAKESERQTKAALMAAGRIELLRAEGYLVEGSDREEMEGDFAGYQWEQSVTQTGVEGLYEVSVAIHHAELKQPVYELQTLLFDPPILSDSTESDRTRDRSGSRRERRLR